MHGVRTYRNLLFSGWGCDTHLATAHPKQGGGDITEMENSYYGVLSRFITGYYGFYGLLLRILRLLLRILRGLSFRIC